MENPPLKKGVLRGDSRGGGDFFVTHNFSISNETESKLPPIDFSSIKEAALGPDYTLSLVIISADGIQKLNDQYRQKNVPTDILSFPLSENEGEIYICPSEAEKEAVKFQRKSENFLAFLFIHGCVHLKGYDHGSTMEAIENEICKKFKI